MAVPRSNAFQTLPNKSLQSTRQIVPYNILNRLRTRKPSHYWKRYWHDGKLPALAVGDMVLGMSPINGLGFEKVFPDGKPAIMKPPEEFIPFHWPAAPTIPVAQQEPLPLEFPEDELDEEKIPHAIRQLVDVLQNIYEAVETQFPPDEEDEDYPVYAATWMFKDSVSAYDLESRLKGSNHLMPLPPRLQFANVVPALISGFLDGNGQNAFQICFQAIISDLDIDPDRAIHVIPAPSETSRKPLSMGVPHCLVYGVPQAVRRATGRARTKSRSRSLSRHDSGGCDRGRNRHRVILKERTGDKSRSRSRSPKADQNIMGDVTHRNENQGTQKPSFAEMERNPQLYCIGADSISAYMEPHKPDLSLIRRIENGNNTVYKVEVVIEITSISRYSGTFDNAVIGATEQCLYACLASLQSNQTCIYGIIILVEGMKALKVVKEDNQWNVYETDLIQFCEGVLLKRMLYMVFNGLL